MSTGGGPGLTQGLFWTIILFLVVIFSMAGALVWYILRENKKRAALDGVEPPR